jgi:hypothetical protein
MPLFGLRATQTNFESLSGYSSRSSAVAALTPGCADRPLRHNRRLWARTALFLAVAATLPLWVAVGSANAQTSSTGSDTSTTGGAAVISTSSPIGFLLLVSGIPFVLWFCLLTYDRVSANRWRRQEMPHDDFDPPEGTSADIDDTVMMSSGGADVVELPAAEQHVEDFAIASVIDPRVGHRREHKLVTEYRTHMEAQGSEMIELGIRPPGEAQQLYCDSFDRTRGNLIEAKSTGSRGEIRIGIGQLYDYRRHIKPTPRTAVLLPDKPREDLHRLLQSAGVAVIWQAGSSFEDDANGAFV